MTTVAEPATVLDACEVAVIKALENAGKRMKGLRRGDRFQLVDAGVPLHDLHRYLPAIPADATPELDRLLKDAWTALQLVHPDHLHLIVACDSYVRMLLIERAHHDRAALLRYLEVACEAVSG